MSFDLCYCNLGFETPIFFSHLTFSCQKSIDGEMSKDEEIERLKREVHKYRLELSNREENFNKIFSDMNPVTLRNGGMSCVKELRDGRTETARSTEVCILLSY